MDIGNDDETKGFKTLTLDIDYYQSLLDDEDIPEDKKQEFSETIWAIMVQFVDMGYGIEATQLAISAKVTQDKQPALTPYFEQTECPEHKEKFEKETIL